jgi:hypothetical protein
MQPLQKSARTSRRIALSGWLVAAALTLVGFTRTTPTEQIRTKRLIVVDDQDRPRTLIGQDPGW